MNDDLAWEAINPGEEENSPTDETKRKHFFRMTTAEDAEFETKAHCALEIQKASVVLSLPQNIAATAQVLFQRFFLGQSCRDHDSLAIAEGALFLACKVEERQTSVRDVLAAFRTRHGEPVPPEADVARQEYWTARATLLRCESAVLRELGFRVFVTEHPHKFALSYLKLLFGSGSEGGIAAALAQAAVSAVNDSLRTDVCARFRPEAIASAAVFLASRLLRVGLPENPPESAWWRLFDTSFEEIDQICSSLKRLYSLGVPRRWDFHGRVPAPIQSAPSTTALSKEIDPPTAAAAAPQPQLSPPKDHHHDHRRDHHHDHRRRSRSRSRSPKRGSNDSRHRK